MTHIGAIKVSQREEGKKSEIVAISDSMASFDDGSKNDGVQKLHKIGNHLILGTGGYDLLLGTIDKLKEKETAEELAQDALQIGKELERKKNSALNLLIVGPDTDDNEIYAVNSILPEIVMENGAEPGFVKSSGYFDGSGLRFSSVYSQGADMHGIPMDFSTLGKTFAAVYGFAKASLSDSGVNDKFQFGIISEKGVSRLYSPDIKLNEGVYGYFKELLGINLDVNAPGEIKTASDFDRAITYNQESGEVSRVVENFYNQIIHALRAYQEATLDYRQTGECLFNDLAAPEHHMKMLEARKAKLQGVNSAVAALKSGNFSDIAEFITSEQDVTSGIISKLAEKYK